MTSLLLLMSLFSCVTAEKARKSDTRTDLGTAYSEGRQHTGRQLKPCGKRQH